MFDVFVKLMISRWGFSGGNFSFKCILVGVLGVPVGFFFDLADGLRG